MVILIIAVDTKGEKRIRIKEAKSIQYRIVDRFEECNPCLILEIIHIYDFVFVSRADQKCFIYSRQYSEEM